MTLATERYDVDVGRWMMDNGRAVQYVPKR